MGLPKPGTTTVVVAQTRYRGKVPRHVKVHVRAPSRLPASDLGLYAIYGRQRGRVTILTAYTILLRQLPSGSTRPSALAGSSGAVESEGLVDFDFAFLAHALAGERAAYGETREEERMRIFSMIQSKQASTGPSPKLDGALEDGGVKSPSPERAADLGPDLIDTGHYDDGHSFGWKSSGTKAAIGSWLRLTDDSAPYEQLIEQIEFNLSVDLNGDGTVEKPKTHPGTSIGTEVGAPVVTSALRGSP